MLNIRKISIVLVGTVVLSSCYQKKAERKRSWTDVYSDLESEDKNTDTTDVVFYIDTFKLVSPHQVAKDLNKTLKRKWNVDKISYAQIEDEDTLALLTQMALSEVYLSVGSVLKNQLMITEHNDKLEELTLLVCEEENSIKPKTVKIDSLSSEMKQFYLDAMEPKYLVYAEARKWLENIYLTLQQNKNITQVKHYQQIIQTQIDNGKDMLVRLYAFQEFEPIANFSQQLISILDLFKEDAPTDEIYQFVSEVRENFGQK